MATTQPSNEKRRHNFLIYTYDAFHATWKDDRIAFCTEHKKDLPRVFDKDDFLSPNNRNTDDCGQARTNTREWIWMKGITLLPSCFIPSWGSFSWEFSHRHSGWAFAPFACLCQKCASVKGLRGRDRSRPQGDGAGCDGGWQVELCWCRVRCPSPRKTTRILRQKIHQPHVACGRCSILLERVS